MYFLKWNFTDMQPFTKRYIAYFTAGIIAAFIFGGQSGAFFIAPKTNVILLNPDFIEF